MPEWGAACRAWGREAGPRAGHGVAGLLPLLLLIALSPPGPRPAAAETRPPSMDDNELPTVEEILRELHDSQVSALMS